MFERLDEQYWDVIVVGAWDGGLQAFLAGRYEHDPDFAGIRLPAFAGWGSAWEEFWIPIPEPSPDSVRLDKDGSCSID